MAVIPSFKLRIESICQGAQCSKITSYRWMIYEEDECVSNSSMVWWQTSKIQLIASIPSNSSTIDIKQNLLAGGRKYRFVVFVRTQDGRLGMSAFDISTSLPPFGGECSIEPASGISLDTNFALRCWGWNSNNGPMSYQFQYHLVSGLNNVINLGLNNSIITQLPSGAQSSNYTLNFTASVTDKNGFSSPVVYLSVQVGFQSFITS